MNINTSITHIDIFFILIKNISTAEQITMEELHKIIKKKYKDFDITPQHLGQVIRDNNITRERTKT